jgi:GWxTD domain-containing protein
MKKLFTLLLLTTFFARAQNKLDFEFDYAQFGYDSVSNYVEFYYSFNQSSLKIENIDSHPTVEGILKIFVQDSSKGDTIVYNQWLVKHEVLDSSLANGDQVLVGTIGFVLPAGTLACKVSGMDLHEKEKSRIIEDHINVIPILHKTMSMSDIQVASKMIQGSENKTSVFYKNTYEVMPIPNLVFGKSQPVLFFYTELYNLQAPDLKSPMLKLNELIYNSRGKILKEKSKEISREANSRVEVGTFILTSYPTDTYTLAIAVIDSLGNQAVTSSKKFYVYNPDVQAIDSIESSVTSSISSMFGAMSEEELDDIFQKSKYLATSAEIEKFKKLNTLEGKRSFLNEFWKIRDENPATPENESFKEYLKRIEIANQRYSAMGRPGWKTDRGRVYLLYGEPSEIERHPNQLEGKPYEIWNYNGLEVGVYFVFADLTGFSDYQLVHSTKRGEIRDDNWSNRINVAN